MKDLCTIETVAFVLRLVLQKLPSLTFTSQFFKHLAAWISEGPLQDNALHSLKIKLIDALGSVAGWTPCQTYVSVGAIMTAAIKTLSSAESSLFNSISRITNHCQCPTSTRLYNQPTLYLEERITNSTLSVQAALTHVVGYNCKMPYNCSSCGEKPTEHSKLYTRIQTVVYIFAGSLELPKILVIELGRHKQLFTSEQLKIEQLISIMDKTYSLLAVLMCDGSHTTCYFWHEGTMYFYDGMLNNGMAIPSSETLSASTKRKHYDHLVYIQCEVS